MAQFSATAIQDIPAGNNIIFDNPSCSSCNCNIIYQAGSGVVMVKGATNQKCARYRVTFNGNAATPEGGTLSQLSFAITLNGAPLYNAVGMTYPAAVEQYGNVTAITDIEVPCGCCFSIAVRNIGAEEAAISNANLTVDRTC